MTAKIVPPKRADRRYFKFLKQAPYGTCVLSIPLFGTTIMNGYKEFNTGGVIDNGETYVALWGTWEFRE